MLSGGRNTQQMRLTIELVMTILHKFNYLSKNSTSLARLSAATGVVESRLWEMVFPVIDDYLRYAVPKAGLRQRERIYRWRASLQENRSISRLVSGGITWKG